MLAPHRGVGLKALGMRLFGMMTIAIVMAVMVMMVVMMMLVVVMMMMMMMMMVMPVMIRDDDGCHSEGERGRSHWLAAVDSSARLRPFFRPSPSLRLLSEDQIYETTHMGALLFLCFQEGRACPTPKASSIWPRGHREGAVGIPRSTRRWLWRGSISSESLLLYGLGLGS